MRISDWSSDVCSSDLPAHRDVGFLIGDALVVEQPLGARAIAAECLGVDFDLCHAFRGVARSGACQSCGSPASTRAQHKTVRSEEHTSELQSLMRISYAVFCLKKTNIQC